MPGRVVEVLTHGTMLTRDRGFLLIRRHEQDDVHVPLSDIGVMMVGIGVDMSSNLLLALHEHGAAVVIAGHNYHPAAILWPVSTHSSHCQRLELQIQASVPLQKRLWQRIVQEKITAQAAVLKRHSLDDEGLLALKDRVHSGDPDNVEAQAARRYWPALLGPDFRRNQEPVDGNDLNVLLNYGYAVIRAAMARALAATGFHPAIGIHHRSQANTFRLVDDLMEPYRPLVDNVVAGLNKQAGGFSLDHDTKRLLAGLLDIDHTDSVGEKSPTSVTTLTLAQSYCASLEKGEVALTYPVFTWEAVAHS